MQENAWRPGLRPTRWVSLQCSPDPLAGGEGLCAPFPRNYRRSQPSGLGL